MDIEALMAAFRKKLYANPYTQPGAPQQQGGIVAPQPIPPGAPAPQPMAAPQGPGAGLLASGVGAQQLNDRSDFLKAVMAAQEAGQPAPDYPSWQAARQAAMAKMR
jgi:hypothetical protein